MGDIRVTCGWEASQGRVVELHRNPGGFSPQTLTASLSRSPPTPSHFHFPLRCPNGCRMLQTTGIVQFSPPIWSQTPRSLMLCSPTHQPIDFDGEVNLFHFNLLRCVGKGAFGKVLHRFYALASSLFVLTRTCQPSATVGPSRSAQADEGSLCPQIHQQGSLRQAKSRLEYHPGEKAA